VLPLSVAHNGSEDGEEKKMIETEGYLRMAAANYHQAESHLVDAEHELRKLLAKLEDCLVQMRKVSGTEPLLWEQLDQIISRDQPLAIEGQGMVGS
jgi:hypothetical protein